MMRARLTAIFALTRVTVDQAIRDRLLYAILLFALGLMVLSLVASSLTLGYRLRIVTDFSMSATTFAGTAIALLLGVGAIGREVDRRTALIQIAKPIARSEFVIGKYLGVVATSWLNLLLMSLLMTGLVALYRREATDTFGWDAYAATLSLAYVRIALAAAIAVCFSAIASTTVALIAALGVTIAGYLSKDLVQLLAGSESCATRYLGSALFYVLPDFGTLDTLARLLHSHPVLTGEVGFAAAYSAAYIIFLLLVACLALSRKDIG